ncbi:MAG: cysteine desulfurase family protein, partial [Candidatus Cybelea sp.]
DRIYLDNSATTPLRTDVADAMRETCAANYNPNSLHAEGRRARAALDTARERIASLLGALRSEIVFTSSGTEANNLALLGVVRAGPAGSAVVAAATEHASVLSALERLAEEGVETTAIPVDSDGRVAAALFSEALHPGTVLASVGYANNEIGTVQPVAELARIARGRGILFHTDAVQAPGWLPLDVRELGVDLLSLSAHKFHGPKGVGALFIRRGTPIAPIIYGGGQEFGLRPGTQNLAGIVGMTRALELAQLERPDQSGRVAALRDRLEAGILAAIPDVRVNAVEPRLPSILNVSFGGAESAALLIALDLAGIAASAGSACTSGSLEPSHVLAALGVERRWQEGAIRFSLGRETTSAEIEHVLQVMPGLVAEVRRPTGRLAGGMGRLKVNGARLERKA